MDEARGIPTEWVEAVTFRDEMEQWTRDLYELSKSFEREETIQAYPQYVIDGDRIGVIWPERNAIGRFKQKCTLL